MITHKEILRTLDMIDISIGYPYIHMGISLRDAPMKMWTNVPRAFMTKLSAAGTSW
jgi:hypothetical protein